VVLAAGASRRMGRVNKLLAEIDGVPMIYRAVETALRSNAAEVVVVSGHQADPLRRALSGLEPRFIHNSSYRQGLATSLMSGIGAVSPSIAGAVVLLGDMPRLSADTVNALIARFFADHGKNICRPVFGGRPGNPVLWPRAWFSEILDIRGDIGARRLLERDDAQASSVEVDDPGIHFDIDEPQDLDSLQATTA
jgi:molybdenum cofactor cytidylyltransferase